MTLQEALDRIAELEEEVRQLRTAWWDASAPISRIVTPLQVAILKRLSSGHIIPIESLLPGRDVATVRSLIYGARGALRQARTGIVIRNYRGSGYAISAGLDELRRLLQPVCGDDSSGPPPRDPVAPAKKGTRPRRPSRIVRRGWAPSGMVLPDLGSALPQVLREEPDLRAPRIRGERRGRNYSPA